MPWLLGAGWLLTILVAWLFHHLMVRELLTSHRQQILALQETHRDREATWHLKEERLLNRCMTKSWQDYVQLQPQVASSTSDHEGIGMSDETEAALWARAMGGGDGFGEVFLEQDLSELGLAE